MTFKEAENMGISFDSLELEYKTLHSLGKSDTLLIEKAGKAYYNFFNAFNTYLTNKNLHKIFQLDLCDLPPFHHIDNVYLAEVSSVLFSIF